MIVRQIPTPADLTGLADEILELMPQKNGAQALTLSGELGTGKTAFVQALAARIGVPDHVQSPTFVIMRTYEVVHPRFHTFVHIDAYRVEDVSEVEVLRIPELFRKPGTVVCIEWPERIASLIPPDAIRLSFAINEDNSRTVSYEY